MTSMLLKQRAGSEKHNVRATKVLNQATLMAKRLNSKLSAHGDETEDLTEEEDDY